MSPDRVIRRNGWPNERVVGDGPVRASGRPPARLPRRGRLPCRVAGVGRHREERPRCDRAAPARISGSSAAPVRTTCPGLGDPADRAVPRRVRGPTVRGRPVPPEGHAVLRRARADHGPPATPCATAPARTASGGGNRGAAAVPVSFPGASGPPPPRTGPGRQAGGRAVGQAGSWAGRRNGTAARAVPVPGRRHRLHRPPGGPAFIPSRRAAPAPAAWRATRSSPRPPARRG